MTVWSSTAYNISLILFKMLILVKLGPEYSLDESCEDWFRVRSHFEARVSCTGCFRIIIMMVNFLVLMTNFSKLIPVMRIISGEEKHEDGWGGEQLQILHKGDKIGRTNICKIFVKILHKGDKIGYTNICNATILHEIDKTITLSMCRIFGYLL